MDAQTDDNAIDLHDLQAQIDLSMSFAQNLITSWVTPAGYAQTNRQRELEDEIKEYMRRPARLGVGAPVPETQGLAREAARLKSKLGGGKKRPRDDEGADVKRFQSDDEEESRTGVIKKRARIDPFSVPFRKNKVIRDNGKIKPTMHPASMKVAPPNQPSLAGDKIELDEVAKGLLAIQSTPENNKESKLPVDHYYDEEEETNLTETVPLSDVKITPLPTGTSKSSTLPLTIPRVSRRNLVDVSSTLNPLLSLGDRTADTSFPQQPLLNLREPENDLACPSEFTPKKKRKRRKKRKSQQSTEIPTPGT